jgi:hypothetical protein
MKRLPAVAAAIFLGIGGINGVAALEHNSEAAGAMELEAKTDAEDKRNQNLVVGGVNLGTAAVFAVLARGRRREDEIIWTRPHPPEGW